MPFDPHQVKALFNAALDLLDPADRPDFLDRECGEDRDLRQRLADLLAAYDQPAGALAQPLAEGPVQTTAPDGISIRPDNPGLNPAETAADSDQTESYRPETLRPAALIGSVIAGRYKLREEIGEGGMGSVYLAEQLQPVKRRVALKLIKVGMDSKIVLARFDSERQALALMDHPNIAKVLDAGTTDFGRPFFVMELVKGIPLTEYCDQHRLGLLERLALFRQICSAVQHAHQKGIIHRDLKPSNILVESHDGKPAPKVIDFGLAKATSGLQLTEQSLYSAFGTVAGTPLYMAPEQATFNAIDIDTRADIYALGVILYETLTGSTPIRRETFRQAAVDEMMRLIREVEPPTPSSRISTSENLPNLAATRQTEPSRLGRFVRGDLDWIVMKALAKERQRRYESPIAFSQDIERFLNHEPVSAGPPTAAYRFKKFVRRNRPQVVAASLVLLVLVGGIIGTTLGLFEARRQTAEADRQKQIAIAESLEKDKARQAEADQRKKAVEAERLARQEADKALAINEFLTNDLLTQAEPANNAAEDKVTLREVLDRAASKVGERFADQPDVGISLRRTIASTYHGLGAWEKAEAQWQVVLDAERKAHPESAHSYHAQSELSHILRHRGRNDAETLAMAKEAADGLARTLGNDHHHTLDSMSNLGGAYLAAGKLDRALPVLEETLALLKSKLGPDHPGILTSMSILASGYDKAGKLDRALPLWEATRALMKSKLGPDHPTTLGSMNNLAECYRRAGKLDRALPLMEETLTLARIKLGVDHSNTILSMNNLAKGYGAAGKLDRAVPLYEELLALAKLKLGPDHSNTFDSMNNLARAYWMTRKLDRSIPLFEECLELRRAKSGEDHPDTIMVKANLGVNYKDAGRLAEALPLLEAANRAVRKYPTLRWVRMPLVDAYIKAGQNDEADDLAKEIVAELGPDHPDTLTSHTVLAVAHEGLGRWADAEPHRRAIVNFRRKTEKPDGVMLDNALAALGENLVKQTKWSEAEPILRECLAIRRKTYADGWPRFVTMSYLGAALVGEQKYPEAEPLVLEGYQGIRRANLKGPQKHFLTEAEERVVRLYTFWGKTEKAGEWRLKIGFMDLPADVFARP